MGGFRFGRAALLAVWVVASCSSSEAPSIRCSTTRECPTGYYCEPGVAEGGTCLKQECTTDGECTDAARPFCDPSIYQCVEADAGAPPVDGGAPDASADAGAPDASADGGDAGAPDSGICTQVCDGRSCGPDSCDGTCGTCPGSKTCNEGTGQCLCVPEGQTCTTSADCCPGIGAAMTCGDTSVCTKWAKLDSGTTAKLLRVRLGARVVGESDTSLSPATAATWASENLPSMAFYMGGQEIRDVVPGTTSSPGAERWYVGSRGAGWVQYVYAAGTYRFFSCGQAYPLFGASGNRAVGVGVIRLLETTTTTEGEVCPTDAFGTIRTDALPAGVGTLRSVAGDVAVGDTGTILKGDLTVPQNPATWTVMTSGTQQDLFDVWKDTSASGWMAVGALGTALRYENAAWVSKETNTTQTLYGVSGSRPGDVWAVGASGTILHWNGAQWSSAVSGTAQHLYSVWVVKEGEAYAVGSNGTILHYVD